MSDSFKLSPNAPKRIHLVLGKAQIAEVQFYLVQEQNMSLYDAKWVSTLEACQTGLGMINEFNRSKLKTLKLNWYFIDEKALDLSLLHHYRQQINQSLPNRQKASQKQLDTFQNEENDKIRAQSQLLKTHFLKEFEKNHIAWNSSSYIPINFHQREDQNRQKYGVLDANQSTIIKRQTVKCETFSRTVLEIDYSSLNCNHMRLKENQRLGTFIGRILFDNHRIYLVKEKNGTLADAKWIYCTGTTRNLKITEKLKRINTKSKNHEDTIYDKKYIIQKLNEQMFSIDKSSHSSIKTQIAKEESQFVINYDEQIRLKEEQECESQLMFEFLQQKQMELKNFIEDESMKLQIIQIIGKTRMGQKYLYLVKCTDQLNNIHFKWKRIKVNCQRSKLTNLLFNQFNTVYRYEHLPYFIPEFRNSEKKFLQLLDQIEIQKIDNIIGKKISLQGTFYLAKFKNSTIKQSKWINCYPNQPNFQYSARSIKKFNQKFSSDSIESYIDKQLILIQMYKETHQSLKGQDFECQMNQKHLYKQMDRIYSTFLAETQLVYQLVKHKFPASHQKIKKEENTKELINEQSIKMETVKVKFEHQSQSNYYEGLSSDEDTSYCEKESKELDQDYRSSKKSIKAQKMKKIKIKKENLTSNQFSLLSTIRRKQTKKESQSRKLDQQLYFSSDEYSSEYKYEWLDDQDCEE